MLVRIYKKNNNWHVVALSGEMYGEDIAKAEGVRLAKARFQESSITGYLTAMYGAQVEEEALNDIDTSRKLGLNANFRVCHHAATHDKVNGGWFNPTTLEQLEGVRFITAMGDKVFYTTKEDIDSDRAKRAKEEQDSDLLNTGAPASLEPVEYKWTAWGYFRAYLTKLKGNILGG